MNKANLKKILNVLIESIDDKRVLYNLEKDVFPYVVKNRTKKKDNEEDDLTEEQKLQLEEGLRDIEEGNTFTLDEFNDHMEKLYPGFKAQIKKRREKEEKNIKKSSGRKLKKKLHKRIEKIKSKYVLNVLLNDIMPDSLNKEY